MRKASRRTAAAIVGAAAAVTLSLGSSPASASAASGTYLPGSSLVSPNGQCKIWENYTGSGSTYKVQGLVVTWGDDCQMGVYRSENGGSFELVSYLYEVWGEGQSNTGFHADPPGYKIHTCLYDKSTGYRGCDAAT
ncbi:hypothetical protein ACWEQ2_31820 [Streptomyces sp. NPDC004096]|uniref:hypothetical protein n=1 Tax=unclassified Streptomyces TaxID=2593676 RepID=UPI0033B33898